MIRAAIVAVFLFLCTLLLGPPLILFTVVTGSAGPIYWTGVTCLVAAGRIAGMRVRAEGRENIPSGVCLFVSNHTSNADIPALLSVMPRRIAFAAKQSLFRIPLVGIAFRLAHFVAIDRTNPEAAMASVKRAVQLIQAGSSFLVFPEGTRSRDGRLQPFKKGSFVMAVEAQVPVVPVACVGAQRVMPKKSVRMHPAEVIVRFGKPIEMSSYRVEDRNEVARRVHDAIAALLPEDQRPAGRAEQG
jgi:1-acyl-sn-glycerol-3-phosphate acyltransferase